MSAPRSVVALTTVALWMGVAGVVFAQSPSSTQTAASADVAVSVYTVPESPAFTFFDITPAKITKPTTARDFVTALVNAIDETGHVRQGVALELEGSRIAGRQPTLQEYQRRTPFSIITRSQVSLASVRAAGDSTSTDVSYGVRVPLYDGGDPMADVEFTTAVISAFRNCTKTAPPLPAIADSAAAAAVKSLVEQEARKTQRECEGMALAAEAKKYATAHWNAPTLSIAYAGGHRVSSVLSDDTRELGNRLWAVGGVPLFGQSAQVLGLVQYANLVPAAQSAHETSLRYGLRSTIGEPTLNAFVEWFHERRTPNGLPSLNRDGWSGGVELRMADNLWLATGFGKSASVTGSPTVIIANLKWALSDQARLAH